ncbi:aromatic acid exporter family protein [Kovacikia minuta CCNUW1]|uniref:aromatic acid exporter family protein n=1 Tax=Kovacikia minuta TaxID=2931930 RepID=UPI001CCF8557|nr:aromatic acid exporter family protein [Kovacikia minuta]UBF27804.1 aromatic acid exporter family protein [Kovacikia minuta CCNUW1]
MQTSLSSTLKKMGGTLAGGAIGGIVGTWLVMTLGAGSITAGVAYILATLVCDVLQFEAPKAVAGLIAAFVGAQVFRGEAPLFYVIGTWIGMVVGLVVLLVFWPGHPHKVLVNNLIQVLQTSGKLFEGITASYQSGTKVDPDRKWMQDIAGCIQRTKHLLNQELYGAVGSRLTQENWSERLASEDRLHRQLAKILKTLDQLKDSQLNRQLAEPLSALVEQISIACTDLAQAIHDTSAAIDQQSTLGLRLQRSPRPKLVQPDFSSLNKQLQAITDQLNQMRTAKMLFQYPLPEVIQLYQMLYGLRQFIQELERLTAALTHRHHWVVQPAPKIRFSWHPIPANRMRQLLKTGFAIWLCLVVLDKGLQIPFSYYAIMGAAVAVQPTMGKTITAGTQLVVVTGIAALYTALLINTIGDSPFALGLGLFLTILTCSQLGFTQGYALGCVLVLICFVGQSSHPNAYIWGRFSEILVGVVVALILSNLFWKNTSADLLDQGISQTLTHLRNRYLELIDSYLQELPPPENLPQNLQEVSQTHAALQSETQQEIVFNLMAARAQRRWNLLLHYEKELIQNIEVLQDVVQQSAGHSFSENLRETIQAAAQATVRSFDKLAGWIRSGHCPQTIPSPVPSFEAIDQTLQNLRTSEMILTYSLDETLPLTVVILTMREIAENLDQVTHDLKMLSR